MIILKETLPPKGSIESDDNWLDSWTTGCPKGIWGPSSAKSSKPDDGWFVIGLPKRSTDDIGWMFAAEKLIDNENKSI